MITYYVARITSRAANAAVRTQLINDASDWLADTYPMDDRADGIRVRVREAEDDPVWRVVVDDNRARGKAAMSTTVTVVSDVDDEITFDVRCVAIPYGDAVGPRSQPPKPPIDLLRLVTRAAEAIGARDVGWPVNAKLTHLKDELEGQSLGAIVGLPTRRLPILVFTPKPNGAPADLPAQIPGLLAANAHCAVLASSAAADGFAQVSGVSVAHPGTIAVIWPGHKGVTSWQIGGLSAEEATNRVFLAAQTIIEGACASLGPVRLPLLRPTHELPLRPTQDESEEIAAQLESAYDEIEELQSALSNAEQQLIDKQEELDDKVRMLDLLIQQNVDFAIQLGRATTGVSASSMPDVLRQAKAKCTNLNFHPELDDSIKDFHFPDPTKVLMDLLRLNVVAGKWITNQIPTASFGIECSNVGLTYTPNISQTAKEKFGSDYTFTWHGTEHLAADHISRGKGANHCRIYFFRDSQSREVVICHIGRHLRDKTSR